MMMKNVRRIIFFFMIFSIVLGCNIASYASVQYQAPGHPWLNLTGTGGDKWSGFTYEATVPCGTRVRFVANSYKETLASPCPESLTEANNGIQIRTYFQGSAYRYIYIFHVTGTYSDWIYNTSATCTTAATQRRTCTSCGRIEYRTVGNALGHTWTGWEADANNHWQRCTRCGTNTNTGTHYDNNGDGKCDVCGRDIQTPVVERVVYESDSAGYWVYSYVHDNIAIQKVVYPSWTDYNGQDDIKATWWNTAIGTVGEWSIDGQIYNNRYRVDKTSHNNESGPYITHIYVYDTTGNVIVATINNIYLKYLVNYIDIIESTGFELGKTSGYTNYGSIVSGSDIGSDTTTGAYYENYQYIGDTSSAVTDQGATVYRKFKLSTICITFHDNGGNNGPGTVNWLIGSINRPVIPSKKGYNFAGWNTSEDGSGNTWPMDNIVVAGYKNYYAQWIPNMYTSVQEK